MSLRSYVWSVAKYAASILFRFLLRSLNLRFLLWTEYMRSKILVAYEECQQRSLACKHISFLGGQGRAISILEIAALL
jgi:hypothetical protein